MARKQQCTYLNQIICGTLLISHLRTEIKPIFYLGVKSNMNISLLNAILEIWY